MKVPLALKGTLPQRLSASNILASSPQEDNQNGKPRRELELAGATAAWNMRVTRTQGRLAYLRM